MKIGKELNQQKRKYKPKIQTLDDANIVGHMEMMDQTVAPAKLR